ncbi:AI-2E family transporter [Pandoraea fibrosis]|uniref:Membrane protein n=1 Tax=Pandoraea fibrosis TaxID=1891094 RepID=A0A5E4TT70_9BURK|nr:membrane protein [Pandoraea fibrosis]QHE90882.1 hypothetical protein PJ20_002880 [Pandoraea fibrosis]QHF11713.1 hypothetical protein PI93_002880 [Pandoraea fibrosis]VVD90781.1 membrane protein [Pandoraea fibrosis]
MEPRAGWNPDRNFWIELTSYVFAAVALWLILSIHLLSVVLSGMVVYQLVHVLGPRLQLRISSERARLVAVALLSAVIVALMTALIFGIITFFRSDAGHLQHINGKMMEAIEQARAQLPAWVTARLPADSDDIHQAITGYLKDHTQEMSLVGKEALNAMVHIVVGLVLGALVALSTIRPVHSMRPLAAALARRVTRFGDAFRRIVFAQVKISAINTVFTAIFLLGVLPLFDIHVPLRKTMIVVTFVVGLLPVVGNLISNTFIVVLGLSVSLYVAITALVFLIVIHKLEYFLNARIVGTQIQSRAWELLLAMIVMEAAFGLPGLIAAPIYYGYLKSELAENELV